MSCKRVRAATCPFSEGDRSQEWCDYCATNIVPDILKEKEGEHELVQRS